MVDFTLEVMIFCESESPPRQDLSYAAPASKRVMRSYRIDSSCWGRYVRDFHICKRNHANLKSGSVIVWIGVLEPVQAAGMSGVEDSD